MTDKTIESVYANVHRIENQEDTVTIDGGVKNGLVTWILDIDGLLIEQGGDRDKPFCKKDDHYYRVLPGTIAKINKWHSKGHLIILMTGRPESYRQFTEEQLQMHGIFYDRLFMECRPGVRILVNDTKEAHGEKYNYPTAVAINVARNVGIAGIDVE